MPLMVLTHQADVEGGGCPSFLSPSMGNNSDGNPKLSLMCFEHPKMYKTTQFLTQNSFDVKFGPPPRLLIFPAHQSSGSGPANRGIFISHSQTLFMSERA